MATAPAAPINQGRRQMQEVKAPELFQFNKMGQVIEGVLLSIEPVTVKGKEAIEYMLGGETGARVTFLGTADLNKKLQPVHIGHFLSIRYESDNSDFQKEGQSAMRIFRVSVSKEKEPGF